MDNHMFECNFANDNAFIDKLKDEYSEHVYEVFGLSFDEFVCAVPGGKQKFNEDCKDAYEQGGMAGLRYIIKSHIAVLDFICFMRTEDKEWFFEDFVERAMSLGIGIRRGELVPWNWSSISSEGGIVQEAANDSDQQIKS